MMPRHINPSEVLLTVREGRANSRLTLREQLIDLKYKNIGRSAQYYLAEQLSRIVSNLTSAGLLLVEEDGNHLAASPLIGQLQTALELSLTDLSKLQKGSIPLAPVFGAPDSSEQVSDIFVLMPFVEALKPVYEDHIKTAAESLNMTVSRADDFFAANSIVRDVWRAIYGSRLVIADCTGRNPNVFYEIGIAHTVGRPTILISQSIDDVPFDLRHWRCIVYQFTPRGMSAFTEALTRTLEAEMARSIQE